MAGLQLHKLLAPLDKDAGTRGGGGRLFPAVLVGSGLFLIETVDVVVVVLVIGMSRLRDLQALLLLDGQPNVVLDVVQLVGRLSSAGLSLLLRIVILLVQEEGLSLAKF